MSGIIQVPLEKLKKALEVIGTVGQELSVLKGSVGAAVDVSPHLYEGQLRHAVLGIAGQDQGDISAEADKLKDQATQLSRIIQAFEAADRLEADFPQMAGAIRLAIDKDASFAQFPWRSLEKVWAHFLPEDRAEMLRTLEGAFIDFLGGPEQYDHGTAEDRLNAFEIFLYARGWVATPPLEVWKSAARAAGKTLEEYVMAYYGITEYERDTAAGVGMTETRKVGPVAITLVGQAMLNTMRAYELKGMEAYGFKKYADNYDLASDRFAGWGPGYANKDQAAYLNLALQGETLQSGVNPYTWEVLPEGVDMLAEQARAAQDGAWRLIAGYKMGDPTFFLADEQSEWWRYQERMAEAGYVQPYSMDEVKGMVEKSYHYNNEYETNPSICSIDTVVTVTATNPETGALETRSITWLENEFRRQLGEEAAQSLVIVRNPVNGTAFETHTSTWSGISNLPCP